jgi:glutamate--cysteine ligase
MSDASLFVAAPPLTVDAAFDRIAAQSFRPTVPARIGAEVESLVTSAADRRRRLDPESLKAVLAVRDALPRRSRLSFEPGGAVELSSRPAASAGECFAELEPDRLRVASALAAEGHELLGLGLDPIRLPRRVLRTPRYQAMEELFDQDGRAGRWMMSNTASRSASTSGSIPMAPKGSPTAGSWRTASRRSSSPRSRIRRCAGASPACGARPANTCGPRSTGPAPGPSRKATRANPGPATRSTPA